MRLLEKEPEERYQSAEGLLYDLTTLEKAIEDGNEMPAFKLGRRDFPRRLAPPSRLVGREDEIRILGEAFSAVMESRNRGLFVAGSPGVGKTVLTNELRPLVTGLRGWFISGKFDQYREDAATDGVRQAFRALGRLLLAEPEEELASIRSKIIDSLGANTRLVAAILPEFKILLGAGSENAENDPLKVEARLAQIGVELLKAIVSPTRPVTMVIDDLQWAGPTPLALLDAVLLHEELRGLLLVGAFRSREVDAAHPLSAMLSRWSRLGVAPRMLELKNLPASDLEELLSEILRLPREEAGRLAEVVGATTDGNPYDTLEFINALRKDGALVVGETGWIWDPVVIRRYIGHGEVVDLLSARIDGLPPETQSLLEAMACLGGELEINLLQVASGLPAGALETQLVSALDDGLLVMEYGGANSVRFRHDRVQQAAYGRLAESARNEVQLQLARRLAGSAQFRIAAAEQYLPVFDTVCDEQERRLMIELFSEAATNSSLVGSHAASDRFLAAAIALLKGLQTEEDDAALISFETRRHTTLYNLGNYEEADALFSLLQRRCRDSLQLAPVAGVQICILCNRSRYREAMELGLSVLALFGLQPPKENVEFWIAEQMEAYYRWIGEEVQLNETARSEMNDPRMRVAAELINRLMPPAFFCDPFLMTWLVLESRRLWEEYGPCPALLASLSSAPLVIISIRKDYRTGYITAQHLLKVGESRGYEAETSWARLCYATFNLHWFEPLEGGVMHSQMAREGLLLGGELQFACFTHYTSIAAMLDTAPLLESTSAQAGAALQFANRTNNGHATASFLCYRQLLRALRGETKTPGSFNDGEFDEEFHLAGLGGNPMAGVIFHVHRALTALVYGDLSALVKHAASAMPLLHYTQGFYVTFLAHLFQALALVSRLRAKQDPNLILPDLDICYSWIKARAETAPANFLHLLRLVEAERAWAAGDFREASAAFDQALFEVASRPRVWHRAIIAERASEFYLEHGFKHLGKQLLTQARSYYEKWGATGKVHELDRAHSHLRSREGSPVGTTQRSSVSVDGIDMLAVLRTSQALSSETSLESFKSRVVELLAAMTGATKVILVLRDEASSSWLVSGESGEPVSVEEAGVRGWLPLSAFRYVERTKEPLLLGDATRDDRFAQDRYVAELEHCSLMLVPIFNQGVPRAILVLENRLSRGAFSADRLDAVALITGQLTVSLENAYLYDSLERKVAERTDALEKSLSLISATLESTTDGILVTDAGGKITGFNTKLLEMWRIPREHSSLQETRWMPHFAGQMKDPASFLSKTNDSSLETETFDVLEFQDGRVYERYSKPQRLGDRCTGRVWSFRDITERIKTEREMEQLHRHLLGVSRQAGMAEVAASVLHNVGNVLNSVNVSHTWITEALRESRMGSVAKAANLLQSHATDLASFLTRDARGQKLPEYLAKLGEQLSSEQELMLKELASLGSNIAHISEIVAAQQSYAKVSGIPEILVISELMEEALRMNSADLIQHRVKVLREFLPVPSVQAEKYKVLQIVLNLLNNAIRAVAAATQAEKQIVVRIAQPDESRVAVDVADNGVGIAPEDLARVFAHPTGQGFGLHSGAIAAKEMGGKLSAWSAGLGKGAIFILELRITPPTV